jgi:hypothetical protein
MTKYEADDAASINKRMEEIKAERWKNIQGTPIEATEAAPDIDWSKWQMGTDYCGYTFDPNVLANFKIRT